MEEIKATVTKLLSKPYQEDAGRIWCVDVEYERCGYSGEATIHFLFKSSAEEVKIGYEFKL